MRGATDLVQYATYHRDRRNIASHFVGVPMIVFALGVLLAKPAFALAGWALTPACRVFAAAAAWYLTRGNLQLGLAVTAVVACGRAGAALRRQRHGHLAGLRHRAPRSAG